MSGNSATVVTTDHGIAPRDVVRGLDTLRFITALWVAFSHGARFPVDRVFSSETLIGKIIYLIGNTTFNGTAAVAVFFVLSGFLIHTGNVGARKIGSRSFWLKRFVRIALPLCAIVLLAHILGPKYMSRLENVLWSIYAELTYYAIYPIFFPVIRRYGSLRVLLISLLVSFAMIAASPSRVYLWSFGVTFTWLFCAPLWLMGCFLAERRETLIRASRRFPVWIFRIAVLGYCYISTILATHLGAVAVGYTWTIWAFGMLCVFWLAVEVSRGTGKSTMPILERFGAAGYSLYLTHMLVIQFMESNEAGLSPLLYWLATLLSVLVFCWIFYRAVELPSHQLARYLGRRMRPAGEASSGRLV
jgi:peptidoglycan/LPS O-acetylase OafA/YrhL